MSEQLQTCDTCPFGKNGRDLTVCIGGEAVPDLLSVPLNYEAGNGNDVLYAVSDMTPKANKVFIAQVDGDRNLARNEKEEAIQRTSVCEGSKGFVFKRCAAGLIDMSQARPKDGFEGFEFNRVITEL